jgi:hypothetical protein
MGVPLVNVLVACEFTGAVRDAFADRGHYAVSCDLIPSETPGEHHVGDARAFLDETLGFWDVVIAHPECTYHAHSSVRWLMDRPDHPKAGVNYVGERWIEWEAAVDFFSFFLSLPERKPGLKVCVENPVPHGYTAAKVGRYSQTIQPWQFGHRQMKRTALWLRNLPHRMPTCVVGPPPRNPTARKDWADVHRAAPGKERKKDRSRTYLGIAEAMAQQWGGQV